MGRVGPQKTFKAQHLSSPFLHTVKQSNCTAAKAWDIYSETTSYIALEGGEDGRCETRHKPLRWDRSVCACYNRRKLYRPSMATCFRCGNWIATTLCPQTPRLVNGRHTQGSEPWWQKILLLGCKQNSCIYGLGKLEQIEIFQQSSHSAFSTFLALLHLCSFSPSSLSLFSLLHPSPPLSLSLPLLSLFPFPSSLSFPSPPLSLFHWFTKPSHNIKTDNNQISPNKDLL